MSPAKPARGRIGKPRKDGSTGKRRAGRDEARDFTVARPSAATHAAGDIDFALAAYALSVHDPRELPPEGIPEIAFAGRSNAGKSSAINALVRRRRLAFVSKTPGRTQLINFFSLGGAYLVDLPGYGYAGVPPAVRRHWEHLVGGYVAGRGSLAAVVVVMDARHPLTPLDLQLLAWLRAAERPVHVLLTKADKLSHRAGLATLAAVRKRLAEAVPGATAQLFSSLRHEGVEEAAAALAKLAAKNKAPAKGE